MKRYQNCQSSLPAYHINNIPLCLYFYFISYLWTFKMHCVQSLPWEAEFAFNQQWGMTLEWLVIDYSKQCFWTKFGVIFLFLLITLQTIHSCFYVINCNKWNVSLKNVLFQLCLPKLTLIRVIQSTQPFGLKKKKILASVTTHWPKTMGCFLGCSFDPTFEVKQITHEVGFVFFWPHYSYFWHKMYDTQKKNKKSLLGSVQPNFLDHFVKKKKKSQYLGVILCRITFLMWCFIQSNPESLGPIPPSMGQSLFDP